MHCNYSAAPQMRERGLRSVLIVHEQVDDEADGALLNSYKLLFSYKLVFISQHDKRIQHFQHIYLDGSFSTLTVSC